jgi:hypothetical protein
MKLTAPAAISSNKSVGGTRLSTIALAKVDVPLAAPKPDGEGGRVDSGVPPESVKHRAHFKILHYATCANNRASIPIYW